jgi:hypothetical protein
MRLERHARQRILVLSNRQIKLLERHSSGFRSRHVEASRPGELLNQDTSYWGTLKAVGKLYSSRFLAVDYTQAYPRQPSRALGPIVSKQVLPIVGVPTKGTESALLQSTDGNWAEEPRSAFGFTSGSYESTPTPDIRLSDGIRTTTEPVISACIDGRLYASGSDSFHL